MSSEGDGILAGVVTMSCKIWSRVTLWLVSFTALLAASAFAFEWEKATPESQGFSSQKLEAFRSNLEARNTKALLVIRNDAIVCEWYAQGHAADKPHGTASLAKAIVGGLSLAVAMSDGRIALDDPATKYIPQWRDDPRKSRITLRQLGSHTSGIEDAEADGLPHEKLTGWKGDFWKRLAVPDDPFTISRDRAPLLFELDSDHELGAKRTAPMKRLTLDRILVDSQHLSSGFSRSGHRGFTVRFPTHRSANLIWLRVHVKPSSGNLFFIVNRR